MSELNLAVAPSPELLALAPATAMSPANGLPATTGPAAGKSGNPFADLLSGVLAAAQSLAPVSEALPLGGVPAPAPDELPETVAEPPALLALPGSAAPPPAAPPATLPAPLTDPANEFASTGLAGKSLPPAGNPLPVDPPSMAAPGTNLQVPPGDSDVAEPTPARGETRQRIFGPDLALTRPAETGPEASRTNQLAGTPLEFTRKYLGRQSQTPIGAPMAEPGSLAQNMLTELTAGMLTVTTTGNPGNGGLPGPAPRFMTVAAGSSSAPLALRQDSGLPATLQPLGDPGAFAGSLADRLLTLGGPAVQTARLQLHPEHLGALNVEIQIEDGTAQVWFGTTTIQAQNAIEGSLPRLRELFAEQGIALTRTQVDTGAGQMGNSGSDQQRRTAEGAPPDVDRPWRAATPARTPAMPGLPADVSGQRGRLDVWA